MGFETHKDLFVEEAVDLLRDVEMPLMELEADPSRRDLVDTIFRAMHTIKGSAGMFGFDEISHFTHDIETTFDAVRKGELAVSSDIIELTLSAKDCIRELLSGNDSDEQKDKRGMILTRLAAISGVKRDASAQTQVPAAEISAAQGPAVSYDISFVPDPGIFLRGVKIAPLFAELASFGEMTVRAVTSDIPSLESYDPDQCYLSWTIRLSTARPEADIRTVFIFVEDYAKITISPAFAHKRRDEEPAAAPAGTEKTGDGAKPLLERRKIDTTSIRVKNEKLDMLVNLVGEMVTLHARFAQESSKERLPEFMSISESLGRLTADLRDITMSVRMVPLAETFTSFNRLIHDLSKNLGKKIRLETEGGETELDKNVIEELRDPMMHIIRNAADHGIESPADRVALGKDETGIVRLSAEYSGSNVQIRISDDGAGLNREKIIAKAGERGLEIADDADDSAVFQLIFEPGFSTAAVTTDISGRGVGMDVVKRNLEKLRGLVHVASERGHGSTITLTIPLTLAIIDGFMVQIGKQCYILNLSMVRECIAFDAADQSDANGLVRLRENYIPYIDLAKVFGTADYDRPFPQVVVIEYEGGIIGFLVDRVIGHCQTVIKPLGKGVRNAEMFSGASILGDGSIALILDVNQVVERSKRMIDHGPVERVHKTESTVRK